MSRSLRWLHISLEVVGVIAIVGGLGWFALWSLFRSMRGFAGANCDETPQQTITTPYGKHYVKTFYRACGAGQERPYKFFIVWLDTGNPNKGFEYTPIVSLRNISPGQATTTWMSPTELRITYPRSAQIDDAYSDTFGIHITLNPIP